MTEHLPECPVAVARSGTFTSCICDRLRACEERVREEERISNFSPDIHWDGMAEAYQRGLDAAREAVAALDAYYAIEECEGNPLEKGDPEDPDPWHQGHLIERDDALAAIDALKEKP